MERLDVTGRDGARSRMVTWLGQVRSLTLEPKGVRGRDGTRLTLGAARRQPSGCPSFVTLIAVIATVAVAYPWVLIAGSLAGSLVLTVLVGTRGRA